MTARVRPEAVEQLIAQPGGSIYVRDYPGDDPPIVAMHGFPDDWRIYQHLIPLLAPRRVVVFDWVGYRHSSRRIHEPFHGGDRQRELTAVLDRLQIDRAVLVGHDASGPEAIDLAIDQPGRVAELVLLNTYYGRTPTLRFPEMISLMADPSYQPLVDALLSDDAQRLWLLFHTGRQFGLEPGTPGGIGELSIFPQFFATDPTADALAEVQAWTAGLPDALDRQDRRIAAGQLRILGPGVTVIFGADDPTSTRNWLATWVGCSPAPRCISSREPRTGRNGINPRP